MTSPPQPSVTLSVNGDRVVAIGTGLSDSRTARLFFRSILGAEAIDSGWSCHTRRFSPQELILYVYDWLQQNGFAVQGEGLAQDAVARELERRRSFQRTREAASKLRAGTEPFDYTLVDRALESFGWSTSRQLRPHQREGVAHALTAMSAANFSVPGSGKTASTLAIAAAHLHAKSIDLVVVVGPLASFQPWETEVHAAVGSRIRVQRVRGSASQRRETYARALGGEILLLSYASAAADLSVLQPLFQSRRVMLVVDESHRVKRFRGGVWAPALAELARHAWIRIILSGTPMPQSGRDLYNQLNILWPDRQLTGTHDAFAARVDGNFSGLLSAITPFIYRAPKSALGLSPPTILRHDVPLEGTQAEIYDLVASAFRRKIQDAESWRAKIDALRRGRSIRLLQAATNPTLFNTSDNYYQLPRLANPSPTLMDRLARYGETEVPAKSAAALRLIREIAAAGGKVVCWSNFVANLDAITRLVRAELRLPCFQIDGRVPAGIDALHETQPAEAEAPGETDTRESLIQQFLGQPGPAVLVTNPASCSESISLHTTCHNAIYLDRTYDCALFLQSIDRIHRLGLPPGTDVRIHILLATVPGGPTIDGLVDQSLDRKAARMRQLLEGAELAPIHLSTDPSSDAEGDEQDLADLVRFLLGETP